MHQYKGKAKCCCGKRAKWRVNAFDGRKFACDAHKEKIASIEEYEESEHLTEADCQAWAR